MNRLHGKFFNIKYTVQISYGVTSAQWRALCIGLFKMFSRWIFHIFAAQIQNQ